MFESLKNLSGPIVITGHTGFKGTWMMLLLEELGIDFVGISLPAKKNSMYERLNLGGRFKEYLLDITNFENLEKKMHEIKPTAIIHLAAQSLVNNSYDFPYETFRSNVLGTANICQTALELDVVDSVLIATTDKVYENQNQQKKFIESDSIKGGDPYSSSKAAVESVINMWQQISEARGGPDYISLRAGNVIGGGDYAENRLMPDIIRSLFETKNLEIRNLNSTRPWQHVLDPLFGYLLTLSNSLNKQIPRMSAFNFATDEVSQSVEWALEIVNENRYVNRSLKFELSLSSRYESKYLDLDATKAKEMLSWSSKWSQREAVDRTITWWYKVLRENLNPYEASIQEVREFLSF